jgi:hypothetical protein
MVKLTTIQLWKYNGPDREPFLLGAAADLSTFGFFQRGTVGEMLTFVGRTVARKTQVGQRQTVQQEEYFCHVFNKDGLVGIAFVDADYPARAGFCVVSKVLEDYAAARGDAWRGATADTPAEAQELLQDALQKYQVRPMDLQQWRQQCWGRSRNGRVCATVSAVCFCLTSLVSLPSHLPCPAPCRTPRLRTSCPRSSATWMRPRSSCTRR